ncbi:hypothetical protein Tco_0270651 [Tanacetum coccineum]
MFILYCHRDVVEDSSLASEINGLCVGLTARIEEREYFIDDLDSVLDIFMPEKMAEFFKQTREKDRNRLMRLQILGREFELRADEKNRYIEKLKGNADFSEVVRLAGEINKVAIEVNNVVIQKDRFLEDLESLGSRLVPGKVAEFLREIQAKDKETVEKMRILEREMELNARKKGLVHSKAHGCCAVSESLPFTVRCDVVGVLCYL